MKNTIITLITSLLITSLLATPVEARQKAQGQRETYKALRDRPYANRTTERHRTPATPYSNEAQAEVRQARRVYRAIREDADPGYYVFQTRPSAPRR